MKKLKKPKAAISLNRDCMVYRKITIIIKGMTLSSFLSIISDFITFNFFKTSMKAIGAMNVVKKVVSRQILVLMADVLHIPELMNTNIVHVGNNMGWAMMEMS